MTKDLCAAVISSLRGAQGRSAPNGNEKRREGIKERAVFSFYFSASAGGCFCEMIKKVLILERSCNDALLKVFTRAL